MSLPAKRESMKSISDVCSFDCVEAIDFINKSGTIGLTTMTFDQII